jgi:hypothetical protein
MHRPSASMNEPHGLADPLRGFDRIGIDLLDWVGSKYRQRLLPSTVQSTRSCESLENGAVVSGWCQNTTEVSGEAIES